MEVEEEVTDYTDADPTVLMLREERAYWEPPAIVEATTKLKKWAWEEATHPIEDSVRKIKTVSHFCQEDQDRRANHSYQEHCFHSY